MTDDRRMYGFSREEWLDPDRLRKRAIAEWESYFAKDEAFKLVQNREHWKGRIDALIPASERKIVEEAIAFFAFGGARFYEVPDDPTTLRVVAPGYWASGG